MNSLHVGVPPFIANIHMRQGRGDYTSRMYQLPRLFIVETGQGIWM